MATHRGLPAKLRRGSQSGEVALYSNVVVALDGSKAAATAITPALELAGAFGATLVLLRVIAYGASEITPGRDYDALRFQAEGYLASLKQSLRSRGVKIESAVRSGDPAAVIIETARSLVSPLLVITAFGRTPPRSEGALGNVAQAVLRSAEGPVVVVRPPLDSPVSKDS